jgi:ribosomal protein L22
VASNYSSEQVSFMIEKYQAKPDRETVDKLAEELNKSIKSIIGKLSREGVYRKAVYKTKTGELPVTKAELIIKIANTLNANSEKLKGLEKAPKQELKYLYELLGD